MTDFMPSGLWGLVIHPVKSFRALVEARERIAVIEEEREVRNREINNIMQRITDTQALLDDARAEIAALQGELARRGVALAEAEAKIRRLTAELDEMHALEARMEEFHKLLGQAEDMKRRYEKRIDILRGKLREYEDKARENDELNIEPEKTPSAVASRAGMIATTRSPGVKATGLPGIPPRPLDPSLDNDWLKPLDEI